MPNFELEKNIDKPFIAGCDEAGRGPLFGRVYAGAVVLPYDDELFSEINDSKKLSEKKREQLFDFICENSISYGIGYCESSEIDELNIRNASFLAMKRAIKQLEPSPNIVLIDGNAFTYELNCPHSCIIKGDSVSTSIAAASILAKVARDRYMRELDEKYPEYGFAKHKGYGTKAHYEAIMKHGVLEEHRKSFNLGVPA